MSQQNVGPCVQKICIITFNLAIRLPLVSCLHLTVTVGLSGPSPFICSVGR